MKRLFACILMLFAAAPSIAADMNGYTAKYECRAGSQYCNVDVVQLTSKACDQVITVSTPWSAINWSNNSICIESGDHTSKGVLAINTSGSASNRKVLKYYRANDNDDEPWKQTASNQAKLRGIRLEGADYWIINRLTVNGGGTSAHAGIEIVERSNADQNIISRVLAEDYSYTIIVFGLGGNDDNTIQNSVVREALTAGNVAAENQCVAVAGESANIRIVNNEIYNCNKNIYMSPGIDPHPGLVIENNDLYTTPSRFYNCSGTPDTNGACSNTEGVAVDSKGGSTAASIGQIIQNRIWSMRPGDSVVSQGGGGWAVSFSNSNYGNHEDTLDGTDHWLVKNNIIWDTDLAFWNYYKGPDHNSIIGNLVFNVYDHGGQSANSSDVGAMSFRWLSNSEFYLNTFVNVTPLITDWGTGTNNDIRCNVILGGGTSSGGYASGTVVDQNAFYGAQKTTTSVSDTNVVYQNLADAKMTQYCFYNKLKTGPSSVCAPSSRPTLATPHLKSCAISPGSRQGVGVSYN